MRRLWLCLYSASLVVFAGCNGDDPEMAMLCPAPDDPFVVPDCILEQIEQRRPSSDITYKVDLFRQSTGAYRYALLPSSLREPIYVFDPCCELDCTLGTFDGGCDWLDEAEDLGSIYEE